MNKRVAVLRSMYKYLEEFDDKEMPHRVIEAYSYLAHLVILSELLFPETFIFKDRVILSGPLFPMSFHALSNENAPNELSDDDIDSFNWIDLGDLFYDDPPHIQEGADLSSCDDLGAGVIKRIWELHLKDLHPDRNLEVEVVGKEYGIEIGLQVWERAPKKT